MMEVACQRFAWLFRSLLLFACIFHGTWVHAGTPCEEAAGSPATLQQGLALAHKVVNALDESGTQVALVARIGQDLSRYRLRFSHLGFVVRNHSNGKWSVVHDLNLCGTDASQLYVQGLGNFFSDDLFVYEAAIMLLPDDLQKKLEKMLTSSTVIARFHTPKYNLVAYPFSTLYQNSNQWALELMASAMAEEGDVISRQEAQRWLQGAGYEPTLLRIPATTRLGARMFKANVAFNDHPGEYRWSDQIYVVSVESVFDFMRKRFPNSTRRILVSE